MRTAGAILLRAANAAPGTLPPLASYREVDMNLNAKLLSTPANGIEPEPAPRIERLLDWRLSPLPGEEALDSVSVTTAAFYRIAFDDDAGVWTLDIEPCGSHYESETVFRLMVRAEQLERLARATKAAEEAERAAGRHWNPPLR